MRPGPVGWMPHLEERRCGRPGNGPAGVPFPASHGSFLLLVEYETPLSTTSFPFRESGETAVKVQK